MDATKFVFPCLAEGHRKKTHKGAVELAKGGTEQDFFARTQHPSFEISKPNVPLALVADNRTYGIGKLVESNHGHVKASSRLGNWITVDVQHA